MYALLSLVLLIVGFVMLGVLADMLRERELFKEGM